MQKLIIRNISSSPGSPNIMSKSCNVVLISKACCTSFETPCQNTLLYEHCAKKCSKVYISLQRRHVSDDSLPHKIKILLTRYVSINYLELYSIFNFCSVINSA